MARGIAGYQYQGLSYHNYVGAYYGGHSGYGGYPVFGGYGFGGNYGGYPWGGYNGYQGASGYPWGGYNGGHYGAVANNPYRHFYGHGRYDLGRFTGMNKAFYQNKSTTQDNEAYLAHVAAVAKHKQGSPRKMKTAGPGINKTFDNMVDDSKVEIVVEGRKG